MPKEGRVEMFKYNLVQTLGAHKFRLSQNDGAKFKFQYLVVFHVHAVLIHSEFSLFLGPEKRYSIGANYMCLRRTCSVKLSHIVVDKAFIARYFS